LSGDTKVVVRRGRKRRTSNSTRDWKSSLVLRWTKKNPRGPATPKRFRGRSAGKAKRREKKTIERRSRAGEWAKWSLKIRNAEDRARKVRELSCDRGELSRARRDAYNGEDSLTEGQEKRVPVLTS